MPRQIGCLGTDFSTLDSNSSLVKRNLWMQVKFKNPNTNVIQESILYKLFWKAPLKKTKQNASFQLGICCMLNFTYSLKNDRCVSVYTGLSIHSQVIIKCTLDESLEDRCVIISPFIFINPKKNIKCTAVKSFLSRQWTLSCQLLFIRSRINCQAQQLMLV